MPVASRRQCEFPRCTSGPVPEGSDTPGPYMSHTDCTTRQEVTEDINNHVNMVHTLPLKHFEAQTERMKATTDTADTDSNAASIESTTTRRTKNHSKVESIPRPKINENCTQSDWSFFAAQ